MTVNSFPGRERTFSLAVEGFRRKYDNTREFQQKKKKEISGSELMQILTHLTILFISIL